MRRGMPEIRKVLAIAGSDSSGGAGMQADIKTITANMMYAMSVITALTAQNTTGVYGIAETTPDFVGQQMDCVFTDIFPDSVKVGMVSNGNITRMIARKLNEYQARNIVVDPVMVSTSGCRLIDENAAGVLISELLPVARVITPNIPEAEVLCGFPIRDEADMTRAAEEIARRCGTAVLVKGGHLVNDAVDILYDDGESIRFPSERIDNPNTHGTGCTLSSAIACGLAGGYSLEESIKRAKDYLTGALRAMLDLGSGSGPLDHEWCLSSTVSPTFTQVRPLD